MADKMQIEILEDGTIKTTTGKVGAVNHKSAEAFLEFMAKETGGKSKRERRGDKQEAHHHEHEHHEH